MYRSNEMCLFVEAIRGSDRRSKTDCQKHERRIQLLLCHSLESKLEITKRARLMLESSTIQVIVSGLVIADDRIQSWLARWEE